MDSGGNMQSSEERSAEKQMDYYLKSIGFHRKRIAKDGSCLFRAVAEQVLHCQSLHTDVRAKCVEFLKQNRDSYEAFIEGDFEEYLTKLQDPQQWVGEVEINALAVMYKRDFLIFQEPGKQAVNITDKNFKDKVRLCFLNGNHYDSVYPVSHIQSAALCQSILYELLYDGVFNVDRNSLGVCQRISRPADLLSDDCMPLCLSSDESDPETEEPLWVENASGSSSSRSGGHSYRGRGRGRMLPDRVRRSLNPTLLRNIEYDLWHKTKRAQQKMDYSIAAGMQFAVGDRCQVRLENGRTYKATIKEVPPDSGQVTVYAEELGKRQVPLWSLRPPNEENSWTTVTNRDKRLSNGHGDWDGRGRGRGRGKPIPASSSSSSVSQATAPGSNGRVQKQHSWPATVEEPGGGKSSRKSLSSAQPAFGLTEKERLAKKEEEMNVALVEIQLRDEHSFPALGTQAAIQAESGRKKEKRRPQRNKTKSPVEDVGAASPSAGDRPKLSASPPAADATSDDAELGPSDQSYASAAAVPVSPPPGIKPLAPSPAGLFSFITPVLPAATPTFIAPIASSPTAAQGFPRSFSPLAAQHRSPSPPSAVPPPAPVRDAPPAADALPKVESLPGCRASQSDPSASQSRPRASPPQPEVTSPASLPQNRILPPPTDTSQPLAEEQPDPPTLPQPRPDGSPPPSPPPTPPRLPESPMVWSSEDNPESLRSDSPPPASQESQLPPSAAGLPQLHPQFSLPLPGTVPLQQLSQLYQDPLYPGFPQAEKGEAAQVPPFSSSKSGDDLPKDINTLRFFFNLGVKAYSMPMFPPYVYLFPLQQYFTMQRNPQSPHFPCPSPPARPQDEPAQFAMPSASPLYDHHTPPSEPPHSTEPRFNPNQYQGVTQPQPPPQRIPCAPLPWQQVPPPRNPIAYPSTPPPYSNPPPTSHAYPTVHPLYPSVAPPYPPFAMGYQPSSSAPDDLQLRQEQLQPANPDPVHGHVRLLGSLEAPPAAANMANVNNNRSIVVTNNYALKKEGAEGLTRTVLLVDPPLNNKPILAVVPDTDTDSSLHPGRGAGSPTSYRGQRRHFHSSKPYVVPGAPDPSQLVYTPAGIVGMPEPLSVACGTEDDYEGDVFAVPYGGQRKPYRGRGGRGRGGYDPGRGGQRRPQGVGFHVFSSSFRGRGRERGY